MAFDRADFYDAELRWHNERFRAAADVGIRERVIDIGCGAGLTTRDAARAAREGSAFGIDVSAELLEIARRRSVEEGLQNVRFELGDAQTQKFPVAYFDVCLSRFGTMFFAYPVLAFANIAQAMRPGARLAWMVWQGPQRNEWATVIQKALAPGSIVNTGAAFSLGDPAVATRLLASAGFTSIEFADVHEPVFYGSDVDAAYEAVMGLGFAKEALAGADAAAVRDAGRRLRDLLDAHLTSDGVLFDSRAWIITARRTGATTFRQSH